MSTKKLLLIMTVLLSGVVFSACTHIPEPTESEDAMMQEESMEKENGDAMEGEAMEKETGDAMEGDAMEKESGDAMEKENGDAMIKSETDVMIKQ